MAMAAVPLLSGVIAGAGSIGAGATLLGSTALAAGLAGLSSALPALMSSQSNQADQMGAQLQAGAAEMEALQLEQSAEFEKTRSIQEEAERKQKLNEILGNQMAMTAGRGIAIGSGSDLAISSFSEQEYQEESDIARTDSEFRQRQMRQNATQARLGGSASLLSSQVRQSTRTFDTISKASEGINTNTIKSVFS